MNYLADTHILLWAITNHSKLPKKARTIIEDEENNIFYSFANIWEIAIKHALRKPDMPISSKEFNDYCLESGYIPLITEPQHAYATESLQYDAESAPSIHRDPFDRLLLAQAKAEGMKLLTHDRLIPFYHEDCIVLV